MIAVATKPTNTLFKPPSFSTHVQEYIHRALLYGPKPQLITHNTADKMKMLPHQRGSTMDPLIAAADEEGEHMQDTGESA